jgi:hypothetical protein
MKTTSTYALRLMTSMGVVLVATSAASVGKAFPAYFDGSTSSDFNVASNWDSETAPGSSLDDIPSIDDGLSATFTSGSVTVGSLRVGTVDKTHTFGETHFGRLTMTGGELNVVGINTLALGRENLGNYVLPLGGDFNRDSFVDGADLLLWQRNLGSTTQLEADGDDSGTIDAPDLVVWKGTYGQQLSGGEIVLMGNSTLRSNGVLVGERSRGLLSIGPGAVAEARIWDTTVEPNQFGGTEDIRVGTWGPAYETFGGEPGLDGNGLVEVRGTLNAKDLYLAEHGAKGALRVIGGTVNLNGELIMDICEGCTSDPAILATRSSTVLIVGSGGAFNIGLDPDPSIIDTMPPPRSLRAASPTAKFSFTADAGGVTPITIAENVGETSGMANINMATLEIDLSAYTSADPLTLIDAAPGNLVGTFGTVTFLGKRTGTLHYDLASGNVYLDSFQLATASGLSATGAAPEPSALLLATLACGALGVKRKHRLS